MPHYRRVGDLPRKRHIAFRDPGGRLYAEELVGQEGFSEESSLCYHRHSPSALVAVEPVETAPERLADHLPLRPRHFRLHELSPGGDPVRGRRLLLGNDEVRLAYVAATEQSPLYRNGEGDELVYVESGSATIETTFGALTVGPGDYAVLPAATTHRYLPAPGEPLRLLVVEAAGHVRFPDRYLTSRGQLREGAPFSERDLRAPAEPLLADDEEVDVLVRTRAGWTVHRHAHHPFDVVGWDGCAYPFALSIHDFEPIVGRIHQPPPVHQTFAGPGFVVCSFVPRPFDFDPEAIPVPYHHANVDSDEVLFYCGGDFMSRVGSGIGQGSVSLHPAGFVHGPQPGSVEAALGRPRTEELAVMVDTFGPLRLAKASRACEDETYAFSWSRQV